MRHILPAQPVTAASFGMLEAASSALLVAVAGFLDRSAACGLGAASGTIDLAPVAAAADDDLGSAAMTKEESARDFHWRFPACQCAIDRETVSYTHLDVYKRQGFERAVNEQGLKLSWRWQTRTEHGALMVLEILADC